MALKPTTGVLHRPGNWSTDSRACRPKSASMTRFVFPDIPGQRGMATTRQLKDAGATLAELQTLSRTGHRVLRTVYAARPGPIPEQDKLVAAFLWAGERSMLTGVHALKLHGFDIETNPPVAPFIVPATCRKRHRAAGVETIRSRTMPNPVMRDDIQIAPIERALADVSRLRQMTDRALKGLTISILQKRRSTPDRIAAELELHKRNATGGVLEGTVAARRGAWSVPEADLEAAVRAHPRLPVMMSNPKLMTAAGRPIGIPDGYFPDAGVVIQVHSKTHHTGTDQDGFDRWTDTLERDLTFKTYDLIVVPVTPETLHDRMAQFLTKVIAIITPRLGWESSNVKISPP